MPAPLLRGLVAALWIPADADGQVLDDALSRQIAFLKNHRVDGLLALGSTGEFVHFSEAQRARLIERIVELAAPMPVLANVSDVSPHVARRLARVAEAAGCVGIAVLPPWYFPVGPEDQLAFFLRVAEATSLPVMLYNFPERVGNRIAPETVTAFATRARMGGLKQSGAEFGYHQQLIALGREHGFPIFTGAETRLHECLGLGCAGTISGLANLIPDVLRAAFDAFAAGRTAESIELTARIHRIGQLVGQIPFPLDISAGVKARGLETGVHKSVVSAATQGRYDTVARQVQAQFAEWGLASA